MPENTVDLLMVEANEYYAMEKRIAELEAENAELKQRVANWNSGANSCTVYAHEERIAELEAVIKQQKVIIDDIDEINRTLKVRCDDLLIENGRLEIRLLDENNRGASCLAMILLEDNGHGVMSAGPCADLQTLLRQLKAEIAKFEHIATVLPSDPYDDRFGLWFTISDRQKLEELKPGDQLFVVRSINADS